MVDYLCALFNLGTIIQTSVDRESFVMAKVIYPVSFWDYTVASEYRCASA